MRMWCGCWLVCLSLVSVLACESQTTGGGARHEASAPAFDGVKILPLEVQVVGGGLDDAEMGALERSVKQRLDADLRGRAGLTIDATALVGEGRVAKGQLGIAQQRSGDGLMLLAELTLSGEDARGPFKVSATAEVRGEGAFDAPAPAALVSALSEALTTRVVRETGPVFADDRALADLLKSKDKETLMSALREMQRRESPALLPRLRGMLAHPDDEVVLAVLAQIGLLKDTKSLSLLKDLLITRDAVWTQRILLTISDIGGAEALSVLQGLRTRTEPGRLQQLIDEHIRAVKTRLDR